MVGMNEGMEEVEEVQTNLPHIAQSIGLMTDRRLIQIIERIKLVATHLIPHGMMEEMPKVGDTHSLAQPRVIPLQTLQGVELVM